MLINANIFVSAVSFSNIITYKQYDKIIYFVVPEMIGKEQYHKRGRMIE